ncbi:MAG: sigma-70 family RNA polymerase sigma factor [Acidobacteria bacterium]|nr:sigma-70 family RNA polymerase sigma factor [Acidobacteriota bacterium]NIM62311.1 sigma-70 family RNA polymerase sigma factor [Acidobacteriota bacterium]NIO58252.1 sigma-70 family RNA polymerase sigma factor [Acidobacteriota bacterium]NIQ29281.1 sigma-70 family RNA polymerase sigma factor [Acidobacteriota bacterium]NIQ83880.1 sigma-70 family RNA polymerase sigma factor [Acidobacteriota bacterium]
MTDTDLRLAREARRGDRQALETLYDRHKEKLLGYLLKMLGNRQTAEDVFHDVWIKVMQSLAQYRPVQGSFRPWLFRVAANAAVDRLRKERRRVGPALDAPAGNDTSERVIDRVPDDAPSPEAEGFGSEIGRALDEALARLPERQRNAVLLRHQQGMSYREISATLQVPENTAKTLVHRGARSLRERLAGWSDDEL